MEVCLGRKKVLMSLERKEAVSFPVRLDAIVEVFSEDSLVV